MNNAMVNVPLSEVKNLETERDNYKKLSETLQKTEKAVKLVVIRRDPFAIGNYQGYYNNKWGNYSKVEIKDEIVSTTYENLDEIKHILRQEQEELVTDKVDRLNRDLKAKDEIRKHDIEECQKNAKDIIAQKDKEIAILKGEEVDKTLQEKIEELEKANKGLSLVIEQLQEKYLTELNKTWWQKLLGK